MRGDNELLISREGPTCTIIINRPEKLNALSPDCLLKIADTLRELSEDDAVHSVVIRGSGNVAFSAGYDIATLPTNASLDSTKPMTEESPLNLAIQSIQAFPYPVIAMINGYAYGAGCALAISCDIRVAGRHARMGMHIAKRGIVATHSGYRLFLKVIGFSHTLDMFLTGRTYDSQRCLDMALVNYVVESDQLDSFTYNLARELSENAPLSLRGTKFILNKITEYPILSDEIVKEFHALQIEAITSEDMKESKRAFREKRKPKFKGC